MNNAEMSDWIKKEVEARGGKINNKAIIILITLTAGDPWQIDSEINKLINYKSGEPPSLLNNNQGNVGEITETDVKELVRGHFEENIFALTDAIGARNRALAAKLLEEELQGGANGVYILSMILRQIKIILQIASAMSAKISESRLSGELKLNSYVARKAAAQSRNFLPAQLKKMLADLLEIDYRIKSGQERSRGFVGLVDFKTLM
jgi:DNA polymerase-3 subunit delta